MKTSTVETWAWALLYGGLLLLCLGLFVPDSADTLSLVVSGLGAVAALLGVGLVLLRSRMGP